MKRLILIIMGVLLCTPLYADMNTYIAGSGTVSGGTEYTVYITDNTTDFNSITYSSETVYSGEDDTRIREASATTNYGTADRLVISRWSSSDRNNTLIKFGGLSNIPSSATITSVTVGINYVVGSTGDSVEYHRCLRNWIESEATWTVYSTGNNWTTAGGFDSSDSSATISGQFVIGSGWNTVTQTSGNLLNDVQDWVDGTATNYGWILEITTGTGIESQFDSNEASDGYRPYLKVIYEN